jgi:hypothetical protein
MAAASWSNRPIRSDGQTFVTASTTSKETQAVFDAATVSVGSLVRTVLKKLVDQIPICSMQLDAVESAAE